MSNDIQTLIASPSYPNLLDQISGMNSATLSHQFSWSHIVELLKIDEWRNNPDFNFGEFTTIKTLEFDGVDRRGANP